MSLKPRRLLLVEDEASIADAVVYALTQAGYEVQVAAEGDSGCRMACDHPWDLILLDLNLPGMSGLEVFRNVKRVHPHLPVIMLTSRAAEVDRILGLELGADDYVTKPFSPRELTARVGAVLRRTAEAPPARPAPVRLAAGDLVLDLEAHEVMWRGIPVRLTRQEFEFLAVLVRHPARVFTRDEVLDRIHDGEGASTDRSVDACVKRVRRKLDDAAPGGDPVETVYGVGYKLRAHGGGP